MKRRFNFSIGTTYIGSTWDEDVELEFDDNATENEIQEQVDEAYQMWLNEHNYGGWIEIE